MATRPNNEPRKSKVRVLFAEIEGGDDTIKEGLHSLAAALSRAMQPPARPGKPLLGAGAGTAAGQQEKEVPQVADVDVSEDVDQLELELDVPEAEKSERRESRPRKPTMYEMVKDLDLRPKDKVSLRDFFAQKRPEDKQEQVAVFVHYLVHELNLTGINSNHLYHCFKDVGEKVPVDIGKVARNVHQRKIWIDASDIEDLRITPQGENFVLHDLPRAKPGAGGEDEGSR
jgi:hypothetical protein